MQRSTSSASISRSRDELLRRLANGLPVGCLARIALEDRARADRRWPRAPPAFRGAGCAAGELEHGAVAEAAARADSSRCRWRAALAPWARARRQCRCRRRRPPGPARHSSGRRAPGRLGERCPARTSGPKSRRSSGFGSRGVRDAGIAGNLRAILLARPACRPPGAGCGCPAAPCPASPTRPCASSMPRNSIEVHTTLMRFWQTPRARLLQSGSAKCCELDQRIDAHVVGLRQVVARVSVCTSEPRRCQYSRGGLGVDDQRVGLGPLAGWRRSCR